ncbi:MAG: hypothetical protein U0U33_17130 [Chitinophagaceae bacterium]
MKRTTKLSYLMQLSWEIQRKKKHTRSKSLQAAWAITLNEDITIYYLVKRHSNKNAPNKIDAQHLTLFNAH